MAKSTYERKFKVKAGSNLNIPVNIFYSNTPNPQSLGNLNQSSIP